MKRIVTLILCAILICSYTQACAESDFFQLVDSYIHIVADCSDKESVVMSASGYDPALCIISFDFTDGNQSIVAIDGDECKVFYFFDDNELMSILFQMITIFDEIEAQLTDGKSLQYEMRFSDTEIHYITYEIIRNYYNWFDK